MKKCITNVNKHLQNFGVQSEGNPNVKAHQIQYKTDKVDKL